ncbi:MAG: CDP-alcohol phosphatidyltransferase family protein [Thermoleophilaceae bacterium]|jgi:phosphatidylglycerophosphate synthase|nr:CDP-alcohol phosphatidyltransferase family protein [Thermoleophilaceae bacterium]
MVSAYGLPRGWRPRYDRLHTGERPGWASTLTTTGELSEGERWTREALDRLRARRFSAPGLVEFLAASFARAQRVRGRRPELVSQSRRFGAAGLAASAALGPRAMVRWLGWWAMLDWHLGMVESSGSERGARALSAADAVTLARLWAAPLARRAAHPAVIALASVTDVADGVLARRAGPTRLGRDLDSAADAAFFHATVGGLVERGSLGRWVLAAERAHLVVGLCLGSASYFGASARPATLEQRAIPASLGAAGLLLAATTDRRVRGGHRASRGAGRWASHAFVTAAIAARTLRGLRAVGRPSGPTVG